MLIDMTFRFDIPEDRFYELQTTIADCANNVQSDKMLQCEVNIPLHNGAKNAHQQATYYTRGLLVDAKQAFV